MKLISMHIDGFGRLSNINRDFSSGLNFILAENGHGKTTTAAFIKAMLFGLPSTNTRKLSDNERKHYKPWNGGAFGGSIDIETQKGRFRITRSFGTKASSDTFLLTDLNTGLESQVYSENIGIELFGIDASSYQKSIYIPQHDVTVSMSSDINARLTGLLQSSDDMDVYDKAIERLDSHMRTFKLFRGDGGLIKEAEDKLYDCRMSINDCEAKIDLANRQRNELAMLEKEIADYEAGVNAEESTIHLANEILLRRKEYENYTVYANNVKYSEEKLKNFMLRFPKGIPNTDDIENASHVISEIDSADAQLQKNDTFALSEYELLSKRFQNSIPDNKELNKIGSMIDECKSKDSLIKSIQPPILPDEPNLLRRQHMAKLLLVSGIVLASVGILTLILGFIFSFMDSIGTALFILGSVALVFGVIFAAASLCLSKAVQAENNKYQKVLSEYQIKQKEYENARLEYNDLYSSIESKLKIYYCDITIINLELAFDRLCRDSERYLMLKTAKASVAEKEKHELERCNALKLELSEFFEKYSLSSTLTPKEAFQTVCNTIRDIEETKKELNERIKAMEAYRVEKNIVSEPPEIIDITESTNKLSELRQQLDEARHKSGVLTKSVELSESSAEELPLYQTQATILEEAIKKYEQKHQTAETAKKLLECAKIRLSSRYLRELENKFSENFEKLSEDSTKKAMINADLGISFNEIGGQKSLDWYSQGEQAVISICLRLALADALFDDELPFLIFDDPFTELDENKLKNALTVLSKLSKDRQIIYFTCHESRIPK